MNGVTNLDDTLLTVDAGTYAGKIAASRIESDVPGNFRYMKKKDGRLILQGAYAWSQGFSAGGFVWKDIPVVDENGVTL
jgi:hypothetical protein